MMVIKTPAHLVSCLFWDEPSLAMNTAKLGVMIVTMNTFGQGLLFHLGADHILFLLMTEQDFVMVFRR